MTYPLQFTAGALINTAGSGNDFVGGTNGYGNVEFNGLPSLSNGYIVDGLETNDPLTNLNSGLSTNLVLGLNSIAEVTVNTLSYAVNQGRYGASQVNYITKSGTNQFHGNLYAALGTAPGSMPRTSLRIPHRAITNQGPRSTILAAVSVGRSSATSYFSLSIPKSVSIALPIVSTATVPSPAFQQYVLGQLPLGGTDAVTGSKYAPAPQLVPFYKNFDRCINRPMERRWRFWAVLSIAMGVRLQARQPTETVAPTGVQLRARAAIPNKCRRCDSTTTSTRKMRLGTGFKRTADYKLPTRTRSTPYSTRFPRSRSIRSPRLHACRLTEPGQLL